jgi:hypothetical protein
MVPNLTDQLMNADAGCCLPCVASANPAAARQDAKTGSMTRVDAPHEAATLARGQGTDEPTPVAQYVPDEPISQQISLQAAQLAAHLQNRQQELDHREAELNSCIARLESDARLARLWLDQQEADLASRDAELTRRCQELSDRGEHFAKQEQEVERRLARLASAEAAQQKTASAPDPAQQEQLHRAAEALEVRQQQLDEAERRLTRSQTETQQLCEQMAADHAAFAEQSAILREQIAAERSQAMAEVEEKRQSVQQRAQQVDQRWAALEQLRSELGRIHRETLEIRLATEELWAQLSGAAPPAALTQSLGRIRAKLAQQYSQASADAAEQKQALESIRVQLSAERDKLVEQKRQFERWAAACREDCQQQVARLVAREQQLRDEKIELRQQWHRWQAERLRYQLELRRLQSHSGVTEDSPAPAKP